MVMRRGRKDVDERSAERDVFAERKRIGDLIETATVSPLLQLDDRALSSIKSLVRVSDANVRAAFDFLLDRLKKNHSQVRYLAVLIVDELFTRSKLFRSLLTPVFETFLLLSVGFRADYPLPPPGDRAALLKKKSIELVEKWNDMFGQHYKPIRLGYDYLKTTLRFESTNAREVATLAAQQRRERQERTQELLRKKFRTLKAEYPDLKSDIQSTLDEIGECLAILAHPKVSDSDNVDVDDDEEFESYGVESLRRLRDEVEAQDIVPHESRDNSAVFDILRDLYKLLATKHLVSLQEWLTVLMRVDSEDERQSRDFLLREIIDFRNRLLKTRDKCEELGIQRIEGASISEVGEDLDAVIWEEGDALTNDPFVRDEISQPTSLLSDTAKSSSIPAALPKVPKESKTEGKEASAIKQELLKQAPMLPWGTFLDTWGSQSAVPANPRGLEFENHWGKVDYDVMIPADKMAEISIRASYYKPANLEILPCLAPLRKGGLCQRRDLQTCPLHGPKVARDDKGNPIHEENPHKKLPSDSKAGVAISTGSYGSEPVDFPKSVPARGFDLAGQAVVEVRKQDEKIEGETGIQLDSLSADPVQIAEQAIVNCRKKDEEIRVLARRQRAKRAREHNDACLRDAALAQTGVGFGDVLGRDLNEGAPDRKTMKRTGGLTALLRKKPTSRDRLTNRLLNGRVREATVNQLIRDEEAAYRESYPNQWTMK